MTGMGVVSCLGHEVEAFYNSLLEVIAVISGRLQASLLGA